jgi:uncharacterized protein (DUF1810 family)
MTDANLIRFLDAQDQVYQQVVEELGRGRKETHWMWFIFAQLARLGRSGMAQHYAIRDLAQAKRYLADSILGPRLRQGRQTDDRPKRKDRRTLELLQSAATR